MVVSCMAGDINLATRIEQAGTAIQALNPESDDYADDLAELRAEFSGPVMDAIFEESLARRAAMQSIVRLCEGSDIFPLEKARKEPQVARDRTYLASQQRRTDADANDISYSGFGGNSVPRSTLLTPVTPEQGKSQA